VIFLKNPSYAKASEDKARCQDTRTKEASKFKNQTSTRNQIPKPSKKDWLDIGAFLVFAIWCFFGSCILYLEIY